MRLHSYFRSGAAWRVRIGLAWKGVAYETVPIDLRTGAQRSADWLERNPQGLVPALELDDGTLLTQSLAILDWLEDSVAGPSFYPSGSTRRAKVRAMALAIAADTHPLQNLRVLKRVEALAGAEAAKAWAHDINATGLAAVEAMLAAESGLATESGLAQQSGPFAFGDEPTLADILIVPQLANARRFGVALEGWPRIAALEAATATLPAFQAARPEAQPDFDG